MEPKELRMLYNHYVWPSPNARIAAKNLGCKTKRLTHEEALNWLAQRTGRTLEDFLKMNKRDSWKALGCITYRGGYYATVYNPIYLPSSRYIKYE